MIVLGLLLGLIIILQIFILISTCRKNYKLDMIEAEVSNLYDLVVTGIGTNTERTTKILDLLSKMADKKKHKKKKDKIYADNTIIKTEMKKGAKFL